MFGDLRIDFDLTACRRGPRGFVGIVLGIAFGLTTAFAQTAATTATSPQSLKKLSIEELRDLEVTSVSRRPEKLSEAASAIQVITSEDMHRSGATTLPEVLRSASNLHVAQLDSSQWAISARGFNNSLANKMLVSIDGRSVYTPLHAGVFWDIQDTLFEDIDRIEVISGSGTTLWGANAVNGIISITTKRAQETQGLLVETGGGSLPRSFLNLRYGGRIGSSSHFRVYGKAFSHHRTVFSNEREADNHWRMGRLIDDLLAFSRLSRKQIEASPVNMGDLASDVFQQLKSGLADQNVRFNLAPLPSITADPALIRQVFINLLSNAAKYSRPRAQTVIDVSGRCENGACIYYVKDNGVGFDMTYAQKLFGVFQRLHSVEKFEGTGVGLAIVQRIIHRHGGRVWAEGKVDGGATFYFSLRKENKHDGQFATV
jgi:outer membrane receptor protein involved in Fe transport